MTYGFHKKVKRMRVSKGIQVNWAFLTVRKGNKKIFLRVSIPCRATLCKLITHFYFYSNFAGNDIWASITKEDLSILKSVFAYRKKYSLWKKTYRILGEKGKEEAWNWFKEKAQVFGMIQEMKGDR